MAQVVPAVHERDKEGILAFRHTTVLYTPSRRRGRMGWRWDWCERTDKGDTAVRREVLEAAHSSLPL